MLLFGASCQWLAAGNWFDRRLTQSTNGNGIARQINLRSHVIAAIILATAVILTQIVLERSRETGFQHPGISFQ